MRKGSRIPIWLWLIAMLVTVKACATGAQAQSVQVPQAAHQYRSELVRNARAIWGMDAPVATFAAQVHQESAWKPGAISHAGAQGLAQFMPTTSVWIAGLYPALVSNQPYNPSWALRALVQYDAWIHARVSATTPCDRMAKVLSGYNGGLGWVQRDEALARRNGFNAATWWGHVETVNAGRSAANWRENRDYPRRILQRLEPAYVAAGWGAGSCS